jgi:uncharacterized membrane protein YcgQ (UPF0703/DUF1980 family)
MENSVGMERLESNQGNFISGASTGREIQVTGFIELVPDDIFILVRLIVINLVVKAGSEAESIQYFMRSSC